MSRPNPAKNRPAWRCPRLRLTALGLALLVSVPLGLAHAEGEPEGPADAIPAPNQPPPPQPEAPRAQPEAPRTQPAGSCTPGDASCTRPAGSCTPGDASCTRTDSPPASTDNLHGLEQRASDLKDQIFRAKARLSLLGEHFLRSTAGGGRAVVTQKTQMGRLFQPLRITYQLDGRELISKGDDKTPLPLTAAQLAELPIWDGGLPPGDHTLAVSIVYRGNGTPALSYFSQYTYTASAAQRFRASDGGTTRIRVTCREKGNPALTDVADRPLIEFVVDDGATSTGTSGTQVAAKAAPLGHP